MRDILIVIQGFSDNDTTSGFFHKTKKTLFDLVNNNIDEFVYLKRLNEIDLTVDEVATIGEKLITSLYKGKLKVNTTSLDRLRYDLYIRIVGNAKISSKFELKCLPPTSAAARQHSLRAYLTIQRWKGNTDLNPSD